MQKTIDDLLNNEVFNNTNRESIKAHYLKLSNQQEQLQFKVYLACCIKINNHIKGVNNAKIK